MNAPKVRYAQNAGVNIAYQVVGDGPRERDLLFVCGTMSHLELWESDPLAWGMVERLASIGRLILFDKPGTGLSDPIPAAPTLDQRTADLIAVLDAVGSERATLIGYSEGGVPSVVLAATQPQRVDALVLLDAPLFVDWDESAPVPRERFDRVWDVFHRAVDNWGAGIFAGALAPTLAARPELADLLGAVERACMSPGMARSILLGYKGTDVRQAARAVRVPTLVMHLDSDDAFMPREFGPYNAHLIEGAVFKTLRGPDHLVWLHNMDLVPDLIAEFLTGGAAARRDDDRILTTVVFTDIVESTRRLLATGDAGWRTALADHDRRLDALLARYDGVSVKHTGDGRLVHFARPARAVRFAADMVDEARHCGLEIRAGIHTGECEAVDGDLVGIAVNIASRVTNLGSAGDVLVSSTVKHLVLGSGLSFSDAGEHMLKGLDGRWPVYRCEEDRPGPLVATGYDTDVRHPVEPKGPVALI